MPELPNSNYETSAKFLLEIDGIALTRFQKVTLGDSEWGIIASRSGTDKLSKVTSSGLRTELVITLEKHLQAGGEADINELIEWHQSGSLDRKSGAITYLDREDQPLVTFEFTDGWISKLTPPELDATQENSPLVFTFEISVGEYHLVS